MSALYADLRRAISGEVRFDAGSRALYATDGSNYRQVPIGVVIPLDVDDVVATVAGVRGQRWRCAGGTARRCCRGGVARASPGNAAIKPSSSTCRSTTTVSSTSI